MVSAAVGTGYSFGALGRVRLFRRVRVLAFGDALAAGSFRRGVTVAGVGSDARSIAGAGAGARTTNGAGVAGGDCTTTGVGSGPKHKNTGKL